MAQRLQNAVVGAKQVKKALEADLLVKVFVALDTEAYLKNRLYALCKEHGMAPEPVPTMRELGAMCGIEVGAACAGVRK